VTWRGKSRSRPRAQLECCSLYRQAKLAGSARVYWQTHQTNFAAMRLYEEVAERSGFIVYRKLF
jgi:hypothetical protein